jgi:hypothetical protein
MLRDHRFREEYTNFISKLLDMKYAIKSDHAPSNRTWYLPHFGVHHPVKKNLRVVFDCSASFGDASLNDMLLQGPDLTNKLLGVLLRFRLGKIAFTADIEAMFHQVRVPPEHQTYLKFLWWPNGNLNQEPEDYQMCVHLFGAVSSPSCANFALRQTVVDNNYQGTEAGETILKNFYVDDMLQSTDHIQTALEVISKVIKLCNSGGFNLTKFVSNEETVINSVPPTKRSNEPTKEISKDETIQRALGVHWCLESDVFNFRVNLQDTPLTRRGILSTISSVYDPLGIAGPFLLKGRKILQEITALKDGWDNQVPDNLVQLWNAWRIQLPSLQNLKIDRCYKPAGFGTVKSMSLHCFADASEVGYGTACYLRQVDTEDKICVSLVCGKSRVAPLKTVTIPRLELTSATLSVKIGALIKEELKQESLQDFYWSDSKITLGYIMNDVRRFRVFVANRCSKIRSYTQKNQWNHIDSKENPADHASRGISIEETSNVEQWLHGPRILHENNEIWKESNCTNIKTHEEDIEIKPISVNTIQVVERNYVLSQLEERISSWLRMIRIVATMIEFCKRCQTNKSDRKKFELTTEDIQNAEKRILVSVQITYFKKELDLYSRKVTTKITKKISTLYRLDPYIEDGLLRVGGRLNKSLLPDELKNPVIIPKNSKIAQRITEFYHKKVQHGGRTSTLNEIRQNGFWLINANSLVRRVIDRCVGCRILRGKLMNQKMGELPPERFSTEGPFTYVGLDMCGPFYIKEGRKQCKRYISLFTCLSSRAVHLETTTSLETDTFIQALRRFVARRGPARQITCDNGKNFVGAKNELARNFKEMNHTKINEFLLSQSCDWIYWKNNTPKASHMGGVWERQIRTVRKVLSALLRDHAGSLNDESFRTLLAEAECIVNSRPLTTESLHDPTSMPLSPNSILTMKNKIVLPPPGIFQKEDMYCRKRWRQVQHLANEFWSRWKKEYIQSLQERQKWNHKIDNMQIGDIVLVKDENLPRNQWPLGRIVKVFPDENDNLIRNVQLYIPTSKSELKRPIHKLCLLVEAEKQC